MSLAFPAAAIAAIPLPASFGDRFDAFEGCLQVCQWPAQDTQPAPLVRLEAGFVKDGLQLGARRLDQHAVIARAHWSSPSRRMAGTLSVVVPPGGSGVKSVLHRRPRARRASGAAVAVGRRGFA